MMRVAHDFGKVRIVHTGRPAAPFVDDDILVETLVDGKWKFYRSFNSLSDDYAHTNAREAAELVLKILKRVS